MRILIISPGIKPVPAIKGGAVENLIEILIRSKEVTNKHEIVLYTVYDEEIEKNKAELDCKIKFIKTNSKSYQLKRIIRHLVNNIFKKYIGNQFIHSIIKEIKKNKDEYDIILVENVPEYGLVLEKIKGKAKMILHLHNDLLNIHTKNAKKIKKVYDKIFSISKYIKQRVNEINIEVNQNVVLYNGVDVNKFCPRIYDRNKLREYYGFNKDDFIFMYSGRLVEEKGVKEMIQAFCNIEDKKCKLLILGKGKEEYYKKLINMSKPKQKDIIFQGFVDYKKIPEIYSIVDVGIIPSTWDEPFGLVVIEFLASGIPVIVNDKGAMKEIVNIEGLCSGEIVKKDENYIENLKNAMIYYLELEKEKMQQKKEAAIINSKKFTKDIYVHNFLKLIEEEEHEQKN